ncbi:DNA polymerase III subunit alpha [Calditerrivibrio nitroreducens]|uniref:DNA polymerase III subunit alpha n=1 Tax=Calditerrivibrio nitroreducens (strain DSM 19672 / NBRC 101217 / Yu37-1) TaxID=768670 RepID=E4TIR9_CALNY|nr:DNA polymerase III subunit alpha [Calditerrivibrio nitroreducens]ADR18024.1 DNA polymerase III, alpha subunit [Calditerrivibrio nitroreducens DSM 19672]
MKSRDFVHLHLHSQYSLLDGAIQINKMMDKLKKFGSSAVAVTDHGTMYGVVDFYKKAIANNIKPIIGCEVYVAPDDRKNRNYEKGEDKNYHLILLAKNNKGLKNLQYLVSLAQLEGFYYKPRIDKELLAKYSEGLIGLSACLAGEIPRYVIRGDLKEAVKSAKEYEDILSKGNFYLELQENGIPEQRIVNRELISIGKNHDIPIVATNDCHYLEKGDHVAHQILMCIQMQTTISNRDKLEFHSDQLYVKSPEEMWEAFSEIPEACLNTLKIAEECNVTIDLGKLHLPHYKVPKGYTVESYFEHLARTGLHRRLARIPADEHKKYIDRLNFELKVIIEKNYAGYYLIVWDFINYSKENGIPVGPGRGSGAGSLVAYALGITDIDPIKFNLLFERFLNPERKSMPDFDIDFCKNRRDEVIKYVIDKYGNDRVAQIVTFGQLLARGVIRDVGRVLEIPLKTVDKVAKMIPEAPGMTLEKALKDDPDLEKNIKQIEKGEELLTNARKLEGLLRQTGMHAAGIVISDKPLIEYVPLCKGQNDEVLTQYEKNTLEEIGLVKFDFLGLKNLTVIDDTVKLIRRRYNNNFDINSIPLNDKKTYELLSNGETTGVFQLESAGMKNLLKKLRPNKFEDIIALVALYRPGPIGSGMLDDFVKRKHGEQKVTYFLPELEPILQDTYGIIVYQEQVMQIAQVIAGYSLGSADLLRRAMGKKKPEEMQKHKEIFLYGSEELKIEGAKKRGFDLKIAEEIFNLMEKFAEYGFNKSHSAAYALISYQTAYLKAHYPVEYMSQLLSSELDKGEKVVVFIEECKRMGIKVLPPTINKSSKDFIIDENSIRFGLGAIKNVGFSAIESIVAAREDGEFKSIYDFCSRVDLRTVNKRVVESLIKTGVFDEFGKKRKVLLNVLDAAIEEGQRKQKNREIGITTVEELLGISDTEEYYPDLDEFQEHDILKMEKELLGFYLTNHPLSSYSNILSTLTIGSNELELMEEEKDVVVGGIIKNIKTHLARTGEKMAFVTLEDLEGSFDIVVFASLYKEYIQILEEDKIIIVKGRYSSNGENRSVVANEILEPNEAMEKMITSITILINLTGFTEDRVLKLKNIIDNYKGESTVKFALEQAGQFKALLKVNSDLKVKPCLALFSQLDSLLGENRYEIDLEY